MTAGRLALNSLVVTGGWNWFMLYGESGMEGKLQRNNLGRKWDGINWGEGGGRMIGVDQRINNYFESSKLQKKSNKMAKLDYIDEII